MFSHSKNQTVKTSIKVAAEDLSKAYPRPMQRQEKKSQQVLKNLYRRQKYSQASEE